MRVVKTLDELKRLAKRKGGFDGHIVLNYGIRSSKRLWYRKNRWTVFNSIDDSTLANLTDKQLAEETNIVKAMKLNSLILD